MHKIYKNRIKKRSQSQKNASLRSSIDFYFRWMRNNLHLLASGRASIDVYRKKEKSWISKYVLVNNNKHNPENARTQFIICIILKVVVTGRAERLLLLVLFSSFLCNSLSPPSHAIDCCCYCRWCGCYLLLLWSVCVCVYSVRPDHLT